MGDPVITLGVVSFLNARPLIEGLASQERIGLRYAVPSALPAMLRNHEVDAALIPVIDLARCADVWERVSDACIGSEGQTLTVRVFSRVPPDKMEVLYVDDDSHTSARLARLIWRHWYKRPLEIQPLSKAGGPNRCASVLLIGDKVVTSPLTDHPIQVDLGEVWREWTGLPFVFAVWAAPIGRNHTQLARLLNEARDRGVEKAEHIAAQMAPTVHWPIDVATRYLTRNLTFRLTDDMLAGMRKFLELAAEERIDLPLQEVVP